MFDINAAGLLVDEMGMPATHSSARQCMEAAQKNRDLSPFELIAAAQKVIHPSMREQIDFSFYAAEAESPMPPPNPVGSHMREALRYAADQPCRRSNCGTVCLCGPCHARRAIKQIDPEYVPRV